MIMFTNREAAGFIPTFLDLDDPRPAAEQINEAYAHGGGWQPFEGFTLKDTETWPILQYPGDPPYKLVSVAVFREELLMLFPHSWLVIFQCSDEKRGEWEVARLD